MTLRFTANVTGVISPSKHQAETLEKAGAKNVTVLSNVIQKVQRTEPEEPLRIVWAGRFAPEKRLHVALKAAQIIEQERENGAEIPAIKFDIAGGDPPKGYAASNVQFHGRVSNHEVTDLIKHASAVLVTSFGFDNQPVIALEGFAKEKPVIVSDPQLQSEFGDASILTQKPDAPGLANTLIELAKNPALLEPHAKAAAEYAGKRGAREHVQALMELISANN